MNDLLRKHGCNKIFALPEGMQELMSDISREVLRAQPADIYSFITNYLSALLVTREHGILAVKILDDLCDCKPSTIERLVAFGLENNVAMIIAEIIQREIESSEPNKEQVKVREANILKKVLLAYQMDEQMAVKICQVIRNAYKDYWYRRKLLGKRRLLHEVPEESWEKAAENTLRLYKTTKPSMVELQQATTKIQAAYRAYYIRKRTLSIITKRGPNGIGNYAGPPVDIAASREMDLGPFVAIQPRTDNVKSLIEEHRQTKKYDPLQAIRIRPDAADDKVSETNSDHLSLAQMNEDLRKASEPHKFEVNLRKQESIERRTSEIPSTPTTSMDDIGNKVISFAKMPIEIETASKEEIPEEIVVIPPKEEHEVISDVEDATLNKAGGDDEDFLEMSENAQSVSEDDIEL